jgi:hypothetical protein
MYIYLPPAGQVSKRHMILAAQFNIQTSQINTLTGTGVRRRPVMAAQPRRSTHHLARLRRHHLLLLIPLILVFLLPPLPAVLFRRANFLSAAGACPCPPLITPPSSDTGSASPSSRSPTRAVAHGGCLFAAC